eukprot:TRINITY_DN4035_c1_g2_i1.p1 TRINITY_DN4035_c1_g2~~TRINITY_DN4035_c1_g2_i1.p1  ORF type:complete len:350 (+),score=58.68 TRINITY_DN4035_c1_g2_i1:50-1051(+)
MELAKKLLTLALRNKSATTAVLAFGCLLKAASMEADLAVTLARKKRMDGQVVWITGGSSGIGEELAKQLVENGALVVISARRVDELRRVADSCCKTENVIYTQLDLGDLGSHRSATNEVLDLIKKTWNKDGIDILVNNAGRSQRSLVEEHLDGVTVESALMSLNYLGTVSLTKMVLSQSMFPRKKGRIVNISSVAGKVPAPVSAGYCASKHALQGWSSALRLEVKTSGISVLNVCPGPIATPIEKSSLDSRGEPLGDRISKNPNAGKMPVDRCCKYIVRAITNPSISETWISPHPVLAFVYIFTYVPSFAELLSRRGVQRRISAYKNGSGIYG